MTLPTPPPCSPQDIIDHILPALMLHADKAKADLEALPTHVLDQIQAANNDTSMQLALEAHLNTPGKRGWAKGDSLINAGALGFYAISRCEHHCPHANSHRPRPLLAAMAPRILACADCAIPMAIKHPDDHPDHCDWCEEPATKFFVCAFTIALTTVHSDACERCGTQLRELIKLTGER